MRRARQFQNDERVVLYQEDCLSLTYGLKRLPDKSVHHVVTDPPYEEHTHENRMTHDRDRVKRARFSPVSFAAMNESRDLAAREMVRVCTGWVLVFCEDAAIGKWLDMLMREGAKRRTTCIWRKPNPTPKFMGNGPAQGFEAIVTTWVGTGQSIWNGGGKSGVYDYLRVAEGRMHETEKPLALMEQLLIDFSKPGQTICDPFMGSGTTGVAAKNLGRKFVGWEIDKKVFDVAQRRISGAVEQTSWEQFIYHDRAKPEAFGGIRTHQAQQLQVDLEDPGE